MIVASSCNLDSWRAYLECVMPPLEVYRRLDKECQGDSLCVFEKTAPLIKENEKRCKEELISYRWELNSAKSSILALRFFGSAKQLMFKDMSDAAGAKSEDAKEEIFADFNLNRYVQNK